MVGQFHVHHLQSIRRCQTSSDVSSVRDSHR